jgi:hypothetical protein
MARSADASESDPSHYRRVNIRFMTKYDDHDAGHDAVDLRDPFASWTCFVVDALSRRHNWRGA